MEADEQIADFEAKAADAQRRAASTTHPDIVKEWQEIAQIYQTMAETRRRSLTAWQTVTKNPSNKTGV